VHQLRRAHPAIVRTAIGLAFAAAVTAVGTVTAGAKPGDKIWTISLGPADHDSMDGNSWSVEVFDAVACKSAGTFTITKSGSKQVQVTAREGAGSASNKGEFGSHFRWRTQGMVPVNGNKTKLWFDGEGRPTRDHAGPFQVIISPANGRGSAPSISGCDK
jgi:hypothetical protein